MYVVQEPGLLRHDGGQAGGGAGQQHRSPLPPFLYCFYLLREEFPLKEPDCIRVFVVVSMPMS